MRRSFRTIPGGTAVSVKKSYIAHLQQRKSQGGKSLAVGRSSFVISTDMREGGLETEELRRMHSREPLLENAL